MSPLSFLEPLIFVIDLPRKPVVLTGLCVNTELAIIKCNLFGYEVVAILDNEHQGSFNDIAVLKYSSLQKGFLNNKNLVICEENIGHIQHSLIQLDIQTAYYFGEALSFCRAHMLSFIDEGSYDPTLWQPKLGPTAYKNPIRTTLDAYNRLRQAGHHINEYFVNVGCHDCKTHDPCYPFVLEGFKGIQLDGQSIGSDVHKRAVENMAMFSDQVTMLFETVCLEGNIGSILREYNVPKNPFVLKIDIDSWDLPVAKAVLDNDFQPDVIAIEINTCYPTGVFFCVLTQNKAGKVIFPKRCTGFHGASLELVDHVFAKRGYSLVGADFGFPDEPAGQRDAIYMRTHLCEKYDISTFSVEEVFEREPIAHTHFLGDHGIDTNAWRRLEPELVFNEIFDVTLLSGQHDFDIKDPKFILSLTPPEDF